MIDFFRRWFGKDARTSPVRDVAALASGVAVPAIRVMLADVASRSHFGGSPNLPAGTPWPDDRGRRLAFLARLSLQEIHDAHRVDWLPESGALLFFYDIDEQPWGFDPAHRAGAAVILVPDLPQPIAHVAAGARESTARIPFHGIAFERIDVVPGPDRDSVRELKLSPKEIDLLLDHAEHAFGDRPKHQVAGVPAPIQGDDMELECQLVTHGLYCGDSSGYEDPRAEILRADAADWMLLFQLDSDDDLDVMWGDGGMLYYWVERERARNGDFHNAWLILQCT